MQKYFAFCLVVLSMAMIAMPIVGQDGKKSPKRLEVSELIVRDPETGNSVTIIASNSTAGIWVENKHLNRSVAMVSTGHTRDASQTFVSIYSGKNVGRGGGYGAVRPKSGEI